jgi:hypothetical protein
MAAGFQAEIHAIGDAGNRETLDFFQQVFADHPEARGQRHKIVHAQVVHPEDFHRVAELGIAASMQPPHAVEDMLTWDHGGGFSLDASVRIEATDREGLERLIRYCARPPFALQRLHLVGGRSDQILYILPKPDPAGRTALRLTALEFLDRLATILPPPRIHRHRYHGVFAPNAPLRPLVTARAREDNAVATQAPGPTLAPPTPPTAPAPQAEEAEPRTSDPAPSRPSRWAALLARIYEVFPLICPTCQEPLTFIAFLTEPEPMPEGDFDQTWGA